MKASVEHWPATCAVPESERESGTVAPVLVGTMAEIYREHFYFVWRNARRLGVPDANLDDVVQDVFIVVHRRREDFDGRVQLRSWIFGILEHVVRGYRRTFQRKSSHCVPFNEGVSTSDPMPSELAERSERIQVLEMLLSQLDEDKARLIVLSELEQWTLREIAEHLGSNTNTVYSRLTAAKKDFARVYARWLIKNGEHRE